MNQSSQKEKEKKREAKRKTTVELKQQQHERIKNRPIKRMWQNNKRFNAKREEKKKTECKMSLKNGDIIRNVLYGCFAASKNVISK